MHIVLMQPTGEMIDRLHLQSLDAFIKLAQAREDIKLDIVRASGSSLLEHVRCELATRFYADTDADVLLWLDSDMTFEDPEPILQMCEDAHRFDAVIGALATTKRPKGQINARFKPYQSEVQCFTNGQLVPIDNIGTGLCAVSRTVFDRVKPSVKKAYLQEGLEVYCFYRSLIINNVWWGEDTSFCYLAREAGCPVFADTRVRVGHRGMYSYHLEDAGVSVELKDSLTIHLQAQKQAAE